MNLPPLEADSRRMSEARRTAEDEDVQVVALCIETIVHIISIQGSNERLRMAGEGVPFALMKVFLEKTPADEVMKRYGPWSQPLTYEMEVISVTSQQQEAIETNLRKLITHVMSEQDRHQKKADAISRGSLLDTLCNNEYFRSHHTIEKAHCVRMDKFSIAVWLRDYGGESLLENFIERRQRSSSGGATVEREQIESI